MSGKLHLEFHLLNKARHLEGFSLGGGIMSDSPQEGLEASDKIDRSIIARWKHKDLLTPGYVSVPKLFLELYSLLNPPLTSGEALFVIQLMSFKWNEKAPFPGYATLAKRMGLSDKAVRRHAATLESKKYLRRIQRIGSTNQFDLNPLFDALLKAKQKFETKLNAKGGRRNV
jgi:hypothetical protein